jgi:hypothetical protein
MYQQFYPDQSFSAGEARTFSSSWTPQAAGTYTMKIGVFSNDWSQNYHWNNSAATIVISGSGNTNPPPPNNPPPSNPPPPSTQAGPLNIWWPSDGATLSGVQPLKIQLGGRDASQYRAFWQVDGGGWVEMNTSSADYPHKEALVDFSGWHWRGKGPYTLNFITAEMNGSTVLVQKSVNIYTP